MSLTYTLILLKVTLYVYKNDNFDTFCNYHIITFYSIYFKYLSEYHQNADSNTFQEFGAINKALIDVELTAEARIKIYKILAAILHLGNVTFEENPSVDGSQIAESTANHFRYAAQLLGIQQRSLEISLLTRKMEITGSDPIV